MDSKNGLMNIKIPFNVTKKTTGNEAVKNLVSMDFRLS